MEKLKCRDRLTCLRSLLVSGLCWESNSSLSDFKYKGFGHCSEHKQISPRWKGGQLIISILTRSLLGREVATGWGEGAGAWGQEVTLVRGPYCSRDAESGGTWDELWCGCVQGGKGGKQIHFCVHLFASIP